MRGEGGREREKEGAEGMRGGRLNIKVSLYVELNKNFVRGNAERKERERMRESTGTGRKNEAKKWMTRRGRIK